MEIQPQDIAKLIDHTNLSPVATRADLDKLCAEAKEYGFASVCVNSALVPYIAERLEGEVPVCSVVGFPLGSVHSEAKAYEAQIALQRGAKEIDMVVNNGLLREGNDTAFYEDIRAVAEVVQDYGGVLKCIIEAGYQTPEQVTAATLHVVQAAKEFPDVRFFTKTSTGMAMNKLLVGTDVVGARVEDLDAIANVHGESGLKNLGIKASGGIRTYDDAVKMLYAMGANGDLSGDQYRIGASAGIAIVSKQ